ncbi:UDP transferase [Diaporthe eres]|uniref:Glycosyltransferase family 28 N-terminal domain-containing protein n=1 Tax=Diaporthe vaccinii TaxID=105482 RepID=A0ABR4EPM3_9PEZI|nr:UDP transferase [Diaporthe eres]
MMPKLSPPAVPAEDQDLKLETTNAQGGQPSLVLRDDKGRVAYPGFVPQQPQSPTSPSPPSAEPQPPAPGGIQKAASDPLGSHLEDLQAAPRPQPGQRSATAAPPRTTRRTSALPPAIKRAGTNVSQLQQALWNTNPNLQDESSSSDSSTDDEDVGAGVERTDQATAAGKKPQPPRPKKTDQFRRFKVGNENYRTKGKVSKRDGRLAISIKDTSDKGYLAKALGATVGKVVPLKETDETEQGNERPTAARRSSETIITPESIQCPKLNIVIMVIGSRGDAQPFLKIGKVLKEQYGHRVRIATHPAFRDFVEKDTGLEFFSVGGDPAELMAFMVKNPGMIPTLETVRAGDIGRRRQAMAEMFEGFWRACINSTDDEKDIKNARMMGDKSPFIADLIIANPPSFAHVHCAEALGIPLLLAFTFPYTPTKSFPHPLATIKKSNVDPGYSNFMSYPLVEMMVWQGLGDLVNDFRVKTLCLDPVSTLWAPGALYRMNVPISYLWSPSLVPKPADWADEVDISGFVFLDLASSFTPPDPLDRFLNSGDRPVYIGFGSIVVDDADKFTEMVFEAVRLSGVRALVSKGWGGLGGENVPDNIFMLENTPHDWLFPKVKACVIHGGAGTTAMALKCGKPTMVVPFFGDQHFWGPMIGRAKAGPEPVPYKHLSAEKLAEGIKYCLTDEAQEKAQEMARDIAREGDGAENACSFFHKHLQLSGKHSMRCSILEDKVAVWWMRNTSLRLSALAADILVEKGYITWRKLRLLRHCEYNDFEGPGEPVTGVIGSIAGTFGEAVGGVASVPGRLAKTSNKRRERKERRRRKAGEAKDKPNLKDQTNGTAKTTQDGGATADLGKSTSKDKTNKSKEPAKTGGVQEGEDEGSDRDGESIHTATTEGTADEGYVDQVAEGVGKSARAMATAPIDLSVALAQGFHNAPRLYGDDTVRRPTRVTGIRSGLRAARSEFLFGVYDAWTGVVRLPYRGARHGGGVEGFAKGVGMGVTGFGLKNIAAVVGPVGYTLKGIKKQVERRRQPTKHIRRARILQGQKEAGELSPEERDARANKVVRGWEVFQALWATVEGKEKAKGGLKAQFSETRTRGQGVPEALESVAMAERTLEEVKRGGKVQTGMKEFRRSEDLARRSGDVSGRQSVDRRGSPHGGGGGGRRSADQVHSLDPASAAARKSMDNTSAERQKRAGASERIEEGDENPAKPVENEKVAS